MKINNNILAFLVITIMISGCAGFRPASEVAHSNYEPNISVLLADFSNYAYIHGVSELKSEIKSKYPDYKLLRKIGEEETGYDAQAFVAYNDEKVIIAVRGSELPFISSDWTNNAKFLEYSNEIVKKYCPNAGMHGGFFQSALRIKTTKMHDSNKTPVFKKIQELQSNNRKVYITGHSLGGAIANILALFTAYETEIKITGIYTYGEPRSGNSAYQSCHDKKLVNKTFRFINNRDIVARVRGPGNYVHLGNLAYFDRDGNLTDINTYSNLGVSLDIITFRFIRDHLMDNYIELVDENSAINPFPEYKEPNN